MKQLLFSFAFFLIQIPHPGKHPLNIIDSHVRFDNVNLVNKPAPTFTLKDLDGKLIKLEDYRGKTVILDFWATWCYPCRKSFPVMKMLINKYKNQSDVVFLFIDTREKSQNYMPLVRKFLKDNRYPFHAVFDEWGQDGLMTTIYNKYAPPGIPAKFIIDPKGIISARSIGFMPRQTNQQMAADLAAEIEKARKH